MSNATVDSDPGASDTDVAVLASLATSSPDDTAGAEDAVDDTPAPPSFADLDLPREVLSALEDMGYFTPTPVQTAVYQKVMDGKDAMVQSRTGTGKTTAFGLPIVSTVDASKRVPQALILTPTRELALQVSRELGMLAKQKGLAVETIYGGAPIGKQITALQAGVHIVAGTPGRVLDLIGRRVLDLKAVRFFVLDECDEMLSMGFLEDIEKISSYVPKDRQTLLFSATMPDEVKRYSKRQMREPEHIALSTGNISVEEIHHAYYIVSGVARARDLLRVLAKEQPESAIIFCNTRDETGMVARFLTKQGLDAEALSSDLSQSDRERVMKRMKDKNLRFLVATDVAARGIDIQELSHVINYSFPESAEVYVHRTGRTGRAGKKGVALSLIGPRELGSFWYLKLLYKITPEERDLPPASVLEGVLKEPLPRIGAPPPPDPLATLRSVVTGEPTEEHLALAKRVLAEADGEKLVALLVGAKVDELAAAKAAVRAAAETARKEREEKERAERTERYGEGGDRPSFGRDRGDRPSFGRDRDRGGGGDRPRFGGDRDRGGGGDRPRFGGDRDRGDRPRYGRDRDGGGGGAAPVEAAPAARLEGEAAPVAVVADRPRPERDGGDRPRFDRDGGDRPRYGRDRDGGGDRPRFDRDRGADAAPARVEGEAAPAVAERARPERDGGDRPRFDRDGGDRPRYGRDRDGGDRDARPSADARPAGDAPREGRPDRDGGDRPRYGRDRDGGDRDARPSADARPAGDAPREGRPDRDGGDRPRYGRDRDGGDRDARPSADARPAGDAPREGRPDRDGGDRPRYGRDRDGGDRDARPSGDRDARPSGDRDARPSGDRDRGDRDARPSGDRDRGDRDARPSGDRDRGDRDARPSVDRDRGDRDARPSGDRDRGDRDARPSGDRDRGDRDARPSGDRDRGDRDARPSGDRDARPSSDRDARPSGDRDARPSSDRDARPSSDRDARPSGEARPDRSERDRFRDERAATFERAAERVEREERAAREARGEPAPEPVSADAGDRPARDGRDRDRGGRGGRDRDRDRPREASADRPAADAAAGRKNGAAPIDQRDFWETWADEKSNRSAEPAPSRDRDRDAAPSRDRDRDRDAAPSRDRDRDRDRDAAPSREAAPSRNPAPSREAAPSDEVRAERPRDDEAPPRRERGGRGRDRKRDDDGPPRRERSSRDAEAAPAAAAAAPVAIVDPASQVRLHVNLGKKHGVTADDVRRLLGEDLGGDAASIGSVAMRDTYCHVRVPSSLAQPIIDAMSGKSHGETAIKVELART